MEVGEVMGRGAAFQSILDEGKKVGSRGADGGSPLGQDIDFLSPPVYHNDPSEIRIMMDTIR